MLRLEFLLVLVLVLVLLLVLVLVQWLALHCFAWRCSGFAGQ